MVTETLCINSCNYYNVIFLLLYFIGFINGLLLFWAIKGITKLYKECRKKNKMEIKKRIKLLKDQIRGIALERRELLSEQRVCRIELCNLKEQYRNEQNESKI